MASAGVDVVATLVRDELARQRQAEHARIEQAERDRFRGGPCIWCGAVDSREVDEFGVITPGWYSHARGQECAWDVAWRGDGSDDELLDKIAVIVRDEGIAGLDVLHRVHFKIEPGLAARIGVVPWIDSGQPPGTRWQHLQPVSESLLRAESRRRVGPPVAIVDAAVAASTPSPPEAPDPGEPWSEIRKGLRVVGRWSPDIFGTTTTAPGTAGLERN